MKTVLFRPAAVKELEALQDRDRDLVETTIERFARSGTGDVKMLAVENGRCACVPVTGGSVSSTSIPT